MNRHVLSDRSHRTVLVIAALLVLAGVGSVSGQGNAGKAATAAFSVAEQGAPFEGYNLFSSLKATTAYLMDNDGNFVHSWETGYRPGNSMYLLENSELLHTGNVNNSTFNAGGAGGIVQTIDWDGNVTWEYEYSSTTHLQHHDVEMLPNGNVLMVAWQMKTEAEALAAGRDPSLLRAGELWPDSVIEVQPTGADTGNIVWEWHVWDHLVQDYDSSKPNYGVVADHPELIDLNYAMNGGADWNHTNSVDYNAELDQIVLSVHNFSEIWVIDHSTTTAEAAGHSGGDSGKGGDLLYRWGNPQTYDAGTAADQQLFVQHDAEWIEAGLPDEGNILIFNNGVRRPDGEYSSIVEIVTPVNPDGSYTLTPGSAYGPDAPVWTYTADPPTDLYAKNISGAQRLPNGNTLICDGPSSYFFEVTPSGETVWEYDYPTGAVFRVERYAPDYPGFDGTPLDPGDPSIKVTPKKLTITASVGGCKKKKLKIKNKGDAPLRVFSVTSSNDNFSVTSPDFPQTVDPGEKLNVKVKYCAEDDETQKGVLTILSNDPDQPEVTVKLKGKGR